MSVGENTLFPPSCLTWNNLGTPANPLECPRLPENGVSIGPFSPFSREVRVQLCSCDKKKSLWPRAELNDPGNFGRFHHDGLGQRPFMTSTHGFGPSAPAPGPHMGCSPVPRKPTPRNLPSAPEKSSVIFGPSTDEEGQLREYRGLHRSCWWEST